MRSMLGRRALAESRARACGARAAVRHEELAVAGKRGLPRGRAPGFMCNAAAEFYGAQDKSCMVCVTGCVLLFVITVYMYIVLFSMPDGSTVEVATALFHPFRAAENFWRVHISI